MVKVKSIMIDADGSMHLLIKFNKSDVKRSPANGGDFVGINMSKDLWEKLKAMPNGWISHIDDNPTNIINLNDPLFS
jgi:hypothetical protein